MTTVSAAQTRTGSIGKDLLVAALLVLIAVALSFLASLPVNLWVTAAGEQRFGEAAVAADPGAPFDANALAEEFSSLPFMWILAAMFLSIGLVTALAGRWLVRAVGSVGDDGDGDRLTLLIPVSLCAAFLASTAFIGPSFFGLSAKVDSHNDELIATWAEDRYGIDLSEAEHPSDLLLVGGYSFDRSVSADDTLSVTLPDGSRVYSQVLDGRMILIDDPLTDRPDELPVITGGE